MIPEQLKKREYRFCKVGKDKRPIGLKWQFPNLDSNYVFDDEELQKHITTNNNYGIVTGFSNLMVIDFDEEWAYNKMKDSLPKTFVVKTGGKSYHYYYEIDDCTSFKMARDTGEIDEKSRKKIETIIDFQGKGKQAITVGSLHSSGRKYEVYEDNPIAKITKEELNKIIKKDIDEIFWPDYLKEKKPNKKNNDIVDRIKREVKITDYDSSLKSGSQLCPFHAEKSPSFSVFEDRTAFFCHAGCGGGDIFNYVMIKEGCDFNAAKEKLMEFVGIKLPEVQKVKTSNKKGKKKDDEPPKVYTSLIHTDSFMWEQGFNSNNNSSYFIKWDKCNNSHKIVQEEVINGVIHQPINGEELNKGAVLLPEEPIEYGTDEDLERDIIAHIHKWLDVSKEFEQLCYYNILLSWVYQKYNTLNYTRALGDTGTGKSRFLFTLGHLHYKPMIVAGALTPAVIFRIINKWQGTLMIDEGDQEKSDETNAFIKIMNCGYERGMIVSRCDKNNPNKIDFFDVFCPKVITTRKRFEDKATEARCMTTIMTQTYRLDIKETLTDDYFEDVKVLRGKLLMWRFRNYDKIDQNAGYKLDLSAYEPRLRQVNRGFVSLFADNKAAVDRFKKYMDKYQETLIEERSGSFDGIIINCLAEMLVNGYEIITSGDLCAFILEKGHTFKYPLTNRGVGKIIRGLGLQIFAVKVHGKTKKAIHLENSILETIFSRYVFDDEILAGLLTKGYRVTEVTELPKTLKIICKSDVLMKKSESQKKLRCHSYPGNLGNSVTHGIAEETIYNPNNIDEVLKFIKEKGEVLIEDLSISTELLEQLKKTGQIFEHKAGMVKIL